MMTNATSDAARSEPKAKVFISYSRADIIFADRLDAALKARRFETMLDRTEIYAFEDWWERIEALIVHADTMVFVLSPESVSSPICQKEIDFAASLNKRFAPILCRSVSAKTLPRALARINWIPFDDAVRFDASMDQLTAALETDIGWIRQHTEYGEAARRWLAAGRHGGLLLRSPTLEVAEYWIVSRPRNAPEPTEEIRTFVAQSREGTRSAQQRRRLVQAFIYTLLVGIIGGLFGWINQSYIKGQWTWYATERPFLAANIWPYVLAPAAEQALKPDPNKTFRECAPKHQDKDYCPEMVVVPARSYTMGSPPTEKDRYDDEGPQHEITIPSQFAVSKFDVTFDEWETCVTYGNCVEVSDAGFGRGSRPVINVSWDDARTYVAWLASSTGKPYHLLSEAEWEYAARAGRQTAYSWGDDIGKDRANCIGCGSEWDAIQTAPVGRFAANAFGLYDMHGNVWEWVEDCYHDSYNGAPSNGSEWTEGGDCTRHVVRGGSWYNLPKDLRAANRVPYRSGSRFYTVGFRVGQKLSP
jgi:formylglycine-generating enzyme required for sulfatase activity